MAGERRTAGRRAAVAVAAALCLVGAADARAAVRITPATVTVTAPSGARVEIDRAPLRLSFYDAAGRPVLREAAGGVGPQTAVPLPQSQFGRIDPAPPTVYRPLSFLVGTTAVTQTPAGQWEGTLTTVTEGGVRYGAVAVRSAASDGTAAHLVLATDDPTGRTLAVTVGPGAANTLSVSARPVPAAGVAAMADSFASPAREAFHGFGGRHDGLDHHGQEFFSYLQQENISSGFLSPSDALQASGPQYMFPNGPSATYYSQPMFISSAGYGFLLRRDEIAHWRMDSDLAGAWQTEAFAPGLDYSVAAGSPAAAIGALTAITGRQRVPPAWAAGSLLDREVKYPSDPPAQHEAEIRSDLVNLDRYGVHLDGYRIEGWYFLPRATLAELIGELRRRGIHPLLYFRPFPGQDNIGTDSPANYDEAIAKGYVATHADGSPYTFVSNYNAQAALIDFTNPAAVTWWQGRIREALDLGADGFMEDFGEQTLGDMHFHDGSTGAEMHNRYPVLYHAVTRAAVDAYMRTHPGRQIFYFTRAGYTGTPGSAATENANFPGDETTDWTPSAGLASQTPDMLNRAIGGAYGFTTDIGGYFDLGPFQPTTRELFIRWAEWAALSPMFRLHGSVGAGTHTPWSYDSGVVALYRSLIALHLAARPLILRLWAAADRTGIPPTRPLWLAAPADPGSATTDQEWLLGDDVLVAPVVTQGATGRSVHFPPGCWREPDTGQTVRGPADATVPAPLERLPYFFRCGTRPFAVAARGPGHRPGRPATARCPAPVGGQAGPGLGPLTLGLTRAQARRVAPRAVLRVRARLDVICFTGGAIRVGYTASGRTALLLTGNRRYALAGVRSGTPLRAAARRLRLAPAGGIALGPNRWYLARIPRVSREGLGGRGIVKVRAGIVAEVGVVDGRRTRSVAAARRLLLALG